MNNHWTLKSVLVRKLEDKARIADAKREPEKVEKLAMARGLVGIVALIIESRAQHGLCRDVQLEATLSHLALPGVGNDQYDVVKNISAEAANMAVFASAINGDAETQRKLRNKVSRKVALVARYVCDMIPEAKVEVEKHRPPMHVVPIHSGRRFDPAAQVPKPGVQGQSPKAASVPTPANQTPPEQDELAEAIKKAEEQEAAAKKPPEFTFGTPAQGDSEQASAGAAGEPVSNVG